MTLTTEWPELDYPQWQDTLATLQLWTQIVGKLRLSLSPWVNHSWQVPLYLTARGLGTSPMFVGGKALELEFDFLAQQLRLQTSAGEERSLALVPRSVADFYAQILGLLHELEVAVAINPRPSEIADATPFAEDHAHASYDGAAAQRFWRALLQADRLLKLFRSGFIGKVSPVHFFWGSFDLAVTRFSGRRAPPHPGGVPGLPDAVVREAYSHEVSSAGFWPGNDAFPEAAFYSYAYPEPAGFRERALPAARYEATLGEFVLPYASVRAAAEPDRLVLDFLTGTYVAAADAARWDRGALECALGVPGRVRALP
jgi:Family of unknown function (DUF5996)